MVCLAHCAQKAVLEKCHPMQRPEKQQRQRLQNMRGEKARVEGRRQGGGPGRGVNNFKGLGRGGANGNVDGEAGENGGSDSDAAYFGGQKI